LLDIYFTTSQVEQSITKPPLPTSSAFPSEEGRICTTSPLFGGEVCEANRGGLSKVMFKDSPKIVSIRVKTST